MQHTAAASSLQRILADDPAASRGAPRRPRWLTAADVAWRAAEAAARDPDGDPRLAARHLLDAWTALVLATWPEGPVPTDMQLLGRAEALMIRAGSAAGERARAWMELSTLLAGRERGHAGPLGRPALAAHAGRLGRLIAAAPLLGPTPRRPARGLALVVGLLGLSLALLGLYLDPAPADCDAATEATACR